MRSDHATAIQSELVTRVARVRKRLVALLLLRSLTLGFLVLAVYITAFAWIDHHIHLNRGGRCAALVIFGAMALGLVVVFVRRLSAHLELKYAASHIESVRPYHQQLLAAIEYHQQPVNYPYSESLARAMLQQLWTEAKDDEFSIAVPDRKLWLFAAMLILELLASGVLVRHHYAYLSRYAARLGRPTAVLDPLPTTRLIALNGDIVVEPNEIVTLQAAIEGRLPRTGTLTIAARAASASFRPADAKAEASVLDATCDVLKTLTLQPIEADAGVDALFQGTYSFSELGSYCYQFAAAGEKTPWHDIRVCTFPEIKSITARISFDVGPERLTINEAVTDFSLSVLAGSEAEITVQANCPLSKAQVRHLDDRTIPYDVGGTDCFTFVTSLQREGYLEFRLQDTQGLWSKELPPLTIRIKEDQPPQFSLRHPEGDGFATNVASVPIRFEIEDDFGVSAATLNLEFGDGRSESIPIPVSGPTRTVELDQVLELEQYDLDIGDAVLFYASAVDVVTSSTADSHSARSDVIFLEVKPYRKKWIQCSDGPPCSPGQGPVDPSLIHDKLIEILEYSRAFLKKTWRLANLKRLDATDEAKLEAIAHDVAYADGQLRLIRDDSRYGFSPSDMAVIEDVLSDFTKARNELLDRDVHAAIPPEKRAYRALRRLVDDKIQGDLKAGSPVIKEHPDKIELYEVQHLTRLERAQVAWQLNSLSQRLAEVAREQEALDRTFMHFLDPPPKSSESFKVNDEKSWYTNAPPSGSPGQESSESTGKGPTPDRTIEGALRPPSNPANPLTAASVADVMKVLRAHQRKLRAELSRLEEQLARVPVGQDSQSERPDPIEARKAARVHIDQARVQMNRFETLLAEQYYGQPDATRLAREAPPLLSAIHSELVLARQALEQEAGSYLEDDTERLRQMALDLESLANAYERAVTPEQRKQLLNELVAVANQFNAISGGPANIPGASRPGLSQSVLAVEGYGDRDIVNAARFAARSFLSRDIDTTKHSDEHVPRTTSGSLRFYDQEIDFFESTARSQR